jgi:acetyl esterase
MIRYQVLWYPVIDYAMPTTSRQRNGEGYLLEASMLDWFRDLYLPNQEDTLNPYAAPLRAASHRGLPPALILAVEYDPLLDEGLAYAKCLAEAGVPTEVHEIKGTIHGFISYYQAIDKARNAIEMSAQRLRAMLGTAQDQQCSA